LAQDQEIEIVGEATNGKEAIEQTRSLKPDIVIMDIAMPVMNGSTPPG
jgi:two-component system chemotaxis response regulator CheB